MLLPCCCIRDSFDVQIDHVLKKLNFDLLRVEGAAGKIFATMLLHSRFPLIWYATWSCSAKVKVTVHTWAIFFPKNRFFSFLIICSTSYYKKNNAFLRKFTVQFKSYSSSLYDLCWLFYAPFWKLMKTSKTFCNSILYLKIVISNKHAKPLIIKNFFSNHSFAAIQVFFFISRFHTSIHRYLCIRFQQLLTDNSIFKHTLKKKKNSIFF